MRTGSTSGTDQGGIRQRSCEEDHGWGPRSTRESGSGESKRGRGTPIQTPNVLPGRVTTGTRGETTGQSVGMEEDRECGIHWWWNTGRTTTRVLCISVESGRDGTPSSVGSLGGSNTRVTHGELREVE